MRLAPPAPPGRYWAAMSQENVEVVLALHGALNRHDLDGLVSVWHPDGEYRAAIQGAIQGEQGAFRGHDGIREWWRELHDVWDDMTTEVQEVRDLGERVVVVFSARARGSLAESRMRRPLRRWSRCGTGRRSMCVTTAAGRRHSKPWGWRSRQAMAEATEEVRAMAEATFGALNARDQAAFLALMAEDVEFTSMVAEAEAATFRGQDGIRQWWETVLGPFQDDLRWDLLDLSGSGDRAVTHVRMSGTLHGVPVEQTIWQAVTLRDGEDRMVGQLPHRARGARGRGPPGVAVAAVDCPSCAAENPAEARFCMSCGNALARRCRSCGQEAPAEAKFCMACGSGLAGGGPPPRLRGAARRAPPGHGPVR